jgi:hypothetical protein
MTKLLRGRVRGRTIELNEDLGLSDGAEVELSVRATTPPGEARFAGTNPGSSPAAARQPRRTPATPAANASARRHNPAGFPRLHRPNPHHTRLVSRQFSGCRLHFPAVSGNHGGNRTPQRQTLPPHAACGASRA